MVERFSAVSATHYRDAWLSVIYDATGDYVKSKRALELAEINGLFDPIEDLALAQEAKGALEVRQHIAWLFQYVQGMNERNWHDMKLRAERQLEQLSLAFPGPSDTSTDRTDTRPDREGK